MSVRDGVEYGRQILDKWEHAIRAPEQFLGHGFQPSDEQLTDGLEFYFAMLCVSLALYSPLAMTHKGDLANKGKITANAILGLVFSAVIALAWHFAFQLVGGQSDFAGTYLAYVYAASPYLPLTALASLLMVAGFPPRLRGSALNPAMSQEALKRAQDDPDFSPGMVALGGIAVWGVMLWSIVVLLRCFSLIHALSSWKFAGAIVLSLVIAAPVGHVLKRIGAIFRGDDDNTEPAQSLPVPGAPSEAPDAAGAHSEMPTAAGAPPWPAPRASTTAPPAVLPAVAARVEKAAPVSGQSRMAQPSPRPEPMPPASHTGFVPPRAESSPSDFRGPEPSNRRSATPAQLAAGVATIPGAWVGSFLFAVMLVFSLGLLAFTILGPFLSLPGLAGR